MVCISQIQIYRNEEVCFTLNGIPEKTKSDLGSTRKFVIISFSQKENI